MTQEKDIFISAMSRAASSVYLVTTDGPSGRAGVTVSAMTSVSADGEKPTLLVCVNDSSSISKPIRENGCFAVSLLTSDQSEIANVFASRTKAPGGDKFNVSHFDILKTGAPVLSHSVAGFDCSILTANRVGTHWIIIGTVEQTHLPDTAQKPLIYGMRSYLKAEPA